MSRFKKVIFVILLIFLSACSANRKMSGEGLDSQSSPSVVIEESTEISASPSFEELGTIIDSLWSDYEKNHDKNSLIKMLDILAALQRENRFTSKVIARKYIVEHAKWCNDFIALIREKKQAADSEMQDEYAAILREISSYERQLEDHMDRAWNFCVQKNYEEAIREYDIALKLRPDNSRAYNGMAMAYEFKGDANKALELATKAVEANPKNDSSCYNLGRYLFNKGQYEKALELYQTAIDLNPENPNYQHAIGRCYQLLGRPKDAVIHFKKYLKNAPQGQNVFLVKGFLASMGENIEDDPEDVVSMLVNRQYDRLEKHLSAVLKEKKKDQDGYSMTSIAMDKLLDTRGSSHAPELILRRLQDWEKSRPSSHFANAALGSFYIDYAWHVRGCGYASTITPKGQELFTERLELAKKYLEKAYELDHTDPKVPANLISVATGLSSGLEEMEKQFQRAIEADNTYFGAYSKKLNFLYPKWYGSWQQAFDFAKTSAQSAPSGSMTPRILAKAHWEAYYRSDDKLYFQNNEQAYQETKWAYEKVLESFPNSGEAHNWLAQTAYLADDFETAKRELEIIGDGWLPGCWGNLAYFQRVRKAVFDKL